jgi:hypothetical protein
MAMTDEQMARLAAASVVAGVSDLADDEDRHGRTPGDYFRMGYRAARADRDAVLEKCEQAADDVAVEELDKFDKGEATYGHHAAEEIKRRIRAIKEKPWSGE